MPPHLKVIEIVRDPGDENAGMRVGREFELVKDRITFGRHEENDIPLFGFDRVRRHGVLIKEGDDYQIEELGESVYPVLVNGQKIHGKTLLRDGDIVSVFRVKLLYRKESRADADDS